jgi:hypothetical protein
VRFASFTAIGEPPQCQDMLNLTDLASVPSAPLAPFTDRLRLAVAAYLARFTGSSRRCTESDLRCYLAWYARHAPNPCDFALVAMLGLLGLRIFEATAADIADLGEEHGHQVLLAARAPRSP